MQKLSEVLSTQKKTGFYTDLKNLPGWKFLDRKRRHICGKEDIW